jgi:hypothetical protein
VISATVTAGSITFLVVDRLMFDKPNFHIFFDDRIVNESGENKAAIENKLAVRVRNIGFRDAYSVQTNIHVLSQDFVIEKDIPGETQEIKIGEDKRWLVPIFDIRYPREHGSDSIEGWIHVEVLSPLSVHYYFFRYFALKNDLVIYDAFGYLSGPLRRFVYFDPGSLFGRILQLSYQSRYYRKNGYPRLKPIKIKLDDRFSDVEDIV